jgi:hypothetical protein
MADRITLSRSLYAPEAVEAAVVAYGELAKFDVTVGGTDIDIEVSDIDPDVGDVLVDEFCNHALFETIVRVRS